MRTPLDATSATREGFPCPWAHYRASAATEVGDPTRMQATPDRVTASWPRGEEIDSPPHRQRMHLRCRKITQSLRQALRASETHVDNRRSSDDASRKFLLPRRPP